MQHQYNNTKTIWSEYKFYDIFNLKGLINTFGAET